MKKVIIVGGGPAGLMAAIAAATKGADVILLEKKQRVGEKLRITGKGRCNITSSMEGEQLMAGYPGNPRFLYSALHEFSNRDLIQYLASRGMETKVERGGRVFPASDRAEDVVEILEDHGRQLGVRVISASKVMKISCQRGQVSGVVTEQGYLKGDSVIIATGGLSYPGTGSTGDGYQWALETGHRLVEMRPGLVPLVTSEKWAHALQGLSLKNVTATAYDAHKKKITSYFGEMLFTSFGVSGPIILSLSRDIGEQLTGAGQTIALHIDLKPALSLEQLEKRIQRDLDKFHRKDVKNSLFELLPRRLVPVIIGLSGLNPDEKSNNITREERRALTRSIKNMHLTITGTRSIAEAIVTAGGVHVQDVNPRTMESKLIKGLYFAGEILDVDGYTGGFNLQAAFSTGYIAGENAAMG